MGREFFPRTPLTGRDNGCLGEHRMTHNRRVELAQKPKKPAMLCSSGFQPACNQASTPSQETTDKRIKKRINGYQKSSHAIPARKRVSLLSSCYLYYIREIRGSGSF
jgi:hypothetical protein